MICKTKLYMFLAILSSVGLLNVCVSARDYERDCVYNRPCGDSSEYNRNSIRYYNGASNSYKNQPSYNDSNRGYNHNPMNIPSERFHNAGRPNKWKL